MYQLKNLEDGAHKLKVKVWDVHNNSTVDYTEFIVASSEDFIIKHLLNYPNPFTTSTSFFFEHNQPAAELDILIQVFTVSGKLVKTIEGQVNATGYRCGPFEWDGLDDYGSRIGRGVYIYRLKVRTNSGQTVEKFEKLVILR
jgi:flagellar hook assembly protein FlgD